MTQPINAAAMGGCHITVLRTAGPYQVATKHWRWNPIRNAWTKISDFSAGGWFTAEVRPVASLDDLSTTLDVIRRDPRAFIVRGELTEQARTAIASDPQQRIRRRKIARDGILPSLQEVALRWIMIDIDGWELPEWGDLADDPDRIIDAAIHALLPDAFHDAACYWQLSASAGFATGTLKAHLFFWLAEPASNTQVKAVLRQHAPAVDLAPYNAAQPHYIADPIIEGGHDPLPRRTGWRKGSDAAVVLPALRPQERPTYAGAGGRSAGGDIDAVLSRLGDGDGLDGFHAPLRTATILYARQRIRDDERDDDAVKARIRTAIAAAPIDKGKRRGVEEYIGDEYLDRLIDGAFGLLAADPDIQTVVPHYTATGVDLAEAMVVMRQEVAEFLQRVVVWHRFARDERDDPEHAGIIATTGLGKSKVTRELLIGWIDEAKTEGRPHRVLWLVPTHKLGAEAAADFHGIGANVAVFRGREADDPQEIPPEDPDAPRVPMCLNLDAVHDALRIGGDIEADICGGNDGPHCPYFAACGYQRQKAPAAEADVLIAAHAFLFHQLPQAVRDGVGLVIVDEGWWQNGVQPNLDIRLAGFAEEPTLHPVMKDRNRRRGMDGEFRRRKTHDPPPVWVVDEEATNDLHALSARAQRAFAATADGDLVSKAGVEAAGLTTLQCDDAIRLEWRRKRENILHPGMSLQARRNAIKAAEGNSGIGRRVGIWRALRDLLEGSVSHTGRLELGTVGDRAGTGRVVLLHRRLEIVEAVAELPILLLDATLPADIVRHFLPRLIVLANVNAKAPHQAIIQVTGGWGKTSLLTHDKAHADENQRRRRLQAMLRDFVARHAQSDGAVITYQGLESCFVDLAGVVTGHFNAIAGLDHLRDVCFLAVIGRPLPRPEDVRCMAAALTGRAIPHENTHTEIRGVLLEDGTGLGLPCRIFADPDLEAIRAAVTDAEVLQAVGRARGVRRTADNPVTILLLADVVLPVPVATVTRWADVRPDLVERMAVRGVVLTSPGDLVICYPDLCGGSADAAEKALKRDGKIDDLGDIPLRITLHRGMSGKYPFFPLRYRPVGRGQQMREAWFRPTIVPNPRAWLEEQLGPLAFFKMANTSDGGTAMMGSQVQTSDISSVTDDKSTIDEGLDPSAVYPPIMLFAPPVGFWRAANEIQIEEAAIARIKLDTKNRYQSDPLISILTYRDKQMNRVNIEWSVPECRMVSKDIPQRDHQVGPPELIVLVHGAGRDV